MRHRNIVFHQLTKHIPWSAFDRAVSTHGSDRRVRRLRTRDQFLALLYGQFSGAASLRDAVRLLDATKVNLSALSEGGRGSPRIIARPRFMSSTNRMAGCRYAPS